MFQTAFQPTAFSLNAFQIASSGDTARSGYWRQFYYNLQEESLKKDAEKLADASVEAVQKASEVVVPRMNKKKAVKKPYEEKPFEPPALPPFKRIPVYDEPVVSEQLKQVTTADNFAVFANKLENKVLNLALEKQRRVTRRRRLRRRAAAILLMAA